jgi:hypothetical protein
MLKTPHPLNFSRYLWHFFEEFIGKRMQQPVHCYVQDSPRLFVYCCRLFIYKICRARSQVAKGLVIVVVNATPDSAITEIFLQESCPFAGWAICPSY